MDSSGTAPHHPTEPTMTMQPVGYNLPTFANITVHVPFTFANQLNGSAESSLQSWLATDELNDSLDNPDRGIRNNCYEATTGRVHEIMHHRSHQSEF